MKSVVMVVIRIDRNISAVIEALDDVRISKAGASNSEFWRRGSNLPPDF